MLIVETEGPVHRIRINRPDVRNAFNDELISELSEEFSVLPKSVRVVVLSGEGKAFCAGGDLQWMRKAAAYTEDQNVEDAIRLAKLFEAVASCHALTIAQIHGAAFGGGCGLVAAADVAVAAEGSLFAFSEVRLGLIPATISRLVIPKIGAGNARAFFATGEAFGADVALRMGLVHYVAPLENLAEAVNERVRSVLRNGPEAVFESKRLAMEPLLSREDAARRLAFRRASDEGKEGVAAFLDKRTASFVVEP
jgi:enoyl-CoA hydratase/carnithine racemase